MIIAIRILQVLAGALALLSAGNGVQFGQQLYGAGEVGMLDWLYPILPALGSGLAWGASYLLGKKIGSSVATELLAAIAAWLPNKTDLAARSRLLLAVVGFIESVFGWNEVLAMRSAVQSPDVSARSIQNDLDRLSFEQTKEFLTNTQQPKANPDPGDLLNPSFDNVKAKSIQVAGGSYSTSITPQGIWITHRGKATPCVSLYMEKDKPVIGLHNERGRECPVALTLDEAGAGTIQMVDAAGKVGTFGLADLLRTAEVLRQD